MSVKPENAEDALQPVRSEEVLKESIDVLKKDRVPLSMDEIKIMLLQEKPSFFSSVQHQQWVEVESALRQNAKIRKGFKTAKEAGSAGVQTFLFVGGVPEVKSREGLLQYLRTQQDGVWRHDLLDSYPGVEDDIALVIAECQASVVKVQNQERLFGRHPACANAFDPNISAMWSAIRMFQGEHDLNELVKKYNVPRLHVFDRPNQKQDEPVKRKRTRTADWQNKHIERAFLDPEVAVKEAAKRAKEAAAAAAAARAAEYKSGMYKKKFRRS
eukprot:ANDGO_00248.mRNA.1 hypothetical protein